MYHPGFHSGSQMVKEVHYFHGLFMAAETFAVHSLWQSLPSFTNLVLFCFIVTSFYMSKVLFWNLVHFPRNDFSRKLKISRQFSKRQFWCGRKNKYWRRAGSLVPTVSTSSRQTKLRMAGRGGDPGNEIGDSSAHMTISANRSPCQPSPNRLQDGEDCHEIWSEI